MIYEDPHIPGWMLPDELQWLYRTAALMESIVEIGCWYGKSTHALLSACKGQVTAVDKWDQNDMLPFGNAEEAYQNFCKNTAGFPNLKVLRMDSIEAAKTFKDKSVDMPFIDGTHSYEAVKADIEAWLPKAKKIICGHDGNPAHTGVWRAIHEIFPKIEFCNSIWIINL